KHSPSITTSYFLLDYNLVVNPSLHTSQNYFNVYTNDSITPFPAKNYFSTSRIPNRKFLIKKFLTFFFVAHPFYPKKVSSRYFDRLSRLLQDKFFAISNRLNKPSPTSYRHTKTYIKFLFRRRTVYLGFYLGCNESCSLPAARVLSANRWRC